MSDKIKPTDAARLELRAAHDARTTATEALAAARDAAARSRAVLDAADADLRDRMAECDAAESTTAAALVRGIRSGDDIQHVVDLHDDQPAVALAAAQSRHAIAERAHAALQADVTAAEQSLHAASAAVEKAAIAVIASEADTMVATLRNAVSTARDLELRFAGLDRLLAASMLDVAAPLAAPVREARQILEARNPMLTSIPGHDPESVITRRTLAYRSALCANPDARFDDIADPMARQPAMPRPMAAE